MIQGALEDTAHVDRRSPSRRRSSRSSVSERSDPCRVGTGHAVHPSSQARGPNAFGWYSRGLESDLLHALDRLPVERDPVYLPRRSTVGDYLDVWEWDVTIARINDALYVESRERFGRDASPTTAILDAPSAKGAVKGALA